MGDNFELVVFLWLVLIGWLSSLFIFDHGGWFCFVKAKVVGMLFARWFCIWLNNSAEKLENYCWFGFGSQGLVFFWKLCGCYFAGLCPASRGWYDVLVSFDLKGSVVKI